MEKAISLYSIKCGKRYERHIEKSVQIYARKLKFAVRYDNLKNKAIKILIRDSYPLAFTGRMPNDMTELFIDMAYEICCLKARVDELEKKIARAHFGQMQDDGETES